MINTLKPGAAVGNNEVKDEHMKKFLQKYGAPEEKQREAVKKLGKDEFFKLMITQIQHQDPLKPYQNEEMAAQMAQFSALEQMVNVNSNLEKLTQAQQPLHQLGASSLIGKFVTVDSSRVFHTEGKESEVRFDLPADVQKVRVSIINERGENVRDIDSGKMARGSNTVSWDGKGSNGLAAKSGTYMVQISAENDRGKNIPVTTQKTDRVHGVNFDGKDVILLTGEIAKPGRVLLREVSKVIDGSQIQGAKPTASAQPQMPIGEQAAEGMGFPAENLEADPELQAAQAAAMQAMGMEGMMPQGPQAYSDDDIRRAIEASDGKPMQGYVPGMMSKFTPVDQKMFNGSANQKPEPAPSAEQLQRALDPNDLTMANPAAEAIKAGMPIPGTEIQEDPKAVAEINPAALEYYKQNGMDIPTARPAAAAANAGQTLTGQNAPSSPEGSVAGKWTE